MDVKMKRCLDKRGDPLWAGLSRSGDRWDR